MQGGSRLAVGEEGQYVCVGVTRLDRATSRAAWVTVDGERGRGEGGRGAGAGEAKSGVGGAVLLPSQGGLRAGGVGGVGGVLGVLWRGEVGRVTLQEQDTDSLRRLREREVAVEASGGGRECEGERREDEVCGTGCCVPGRAWGGLHSGCAGGVWWVQCSVSNTVCSVQLLCSTVQCSLQYSV